MTWKQMREEDEEREAQKKEREIKQGKGRREIKGKGRKERERKTKGKGKKGERMCCLASSPLRLLLVFHSFPFSFPFKLWNLCYEFSNKILLIEKLSPGIK